MSLTQSIGNFSWVNRTFEMTRNGYNQRMKDAARNGVPSNQALVKGSYATSQDHLKKWLEDGNQLRMGKMQRVSDLMDMPPITRKREGANGQFNDVINLKSAHFAALSNAQVIKKGKGKGKGKARLSEGMASSSKNATDYIHNVKVQIDMVKCHFCQAENLEGTHKCQSCFKWLIAWTDGRIATEVCRLESTAKKINGLFSLDRIDFEKQPRAQRVSDRVKADQRRAGRSNYGNVRDAATTHAGR